MSETPANPDQSRYWNEQAGPKWAALQRPLDAQLEPLGSAAIAALDLRPGERVLDVGCGAGATTLALAARVAPGEVVGLDISQPLIDAARARVADRSHLRFELGDAQTTRFAAPFDVVYSRFGVMFFADPVAAFTNLRAALRPGGRLGFVCWRAMADNPWSTAPLTAALPLLPSPPPPPVPGAPGPFAFADGDRVRQILADAGFADITVTPHDEPMVLAGDGFEATVDTTLQIGPLGHALAGAPPELRAAVRAAVRDVLARHLGPRGVTLMSGTWQVHARRDGSTARPSGPGSIP